MIISKKYALELLKSGKAVCYDQIMDDKHEYYAVLDCGGYDRTNHVLNNDGTFDEYIRDPKEIYANI